VNGCDDLGDFVGGPGPKPRVIGYWEINQVRNGAAAAGATDVVIDRQSKGHVVGQGYRCP
jgi:hypothetical protein